jgi:hypothetical protein
LIFQTEKSSNCFISIKTQKAMSIEATILLSKLLFSQQRIEEALKYLTTQNIHNVLTDHIKTLKELRKHSQQPQQQSPPQQAKADSLRQLQIYAEGHAIKGLCLEHKSSSSLLGPGQSTGKQTADELKTDEDDIIDSFETSSQFAIQHSVLMQQKIEKSTPASSNTNTLQVGQGSGGTGGISASATANDIAATLNALNNNDDNLDLINPLYEVSLQKAPLLYIKKGCGERKCSLK